MGDATGGARERHGTPHIKNPIKHHTIPIENQSGITLSQYQGATASVGEKIRLRPCMLETETQTDRECKVEI